MHILRGLQYHDTVHLKILVVKIFSYLMAATGVNLAKTHKCHALLMLT